MTRADKLRETLAFLGLKIDKEILIKDAGKIYSIIKASKGRGNYSLLEFKVGPCVLKDRGEYFREYIEKILRYEESKAKGNEGKSHEVLLSELKNLLK